MPGPAIYPYKLPRLVKPKLDAKRQDWYVVYYITDISTGQMVRKYIYDDFKECKNDREREKLGARIVQDLALWLSNGGYYDPELEKSKNFNLPAPIVEIAPEEVPEEELPVLVTEAFRMCIAAKAKRRLSTREDYKKIAGRFVDYVERVAPSMFLKDLNRKFIEAYLGELYATGKISNRTYNNHRNLIKTVCIWLIDEEMMTVNPMSRIERLPPSNNKNYAFTLEDQSLILNFCKDNYPPYLFLSQFMYYTLMRPNELRLLQIRHIGLFQPNKIFVPAEHCKNNREKHLVIPDQLKELIEAAKLHFLPKDYYVFGKEGSLPGPEPYANVHTFSRSYIKLVLRHLGYDFRYTLYSWKPTATIALYNSTEIPMGETKEHAGWAGAESYEAYLKSLGLMGTRSIEKHYPALPDIASKTNHESDEH